MILVALNLIVFGSVVAQRMLITAPANAERLVLEKVPPQTATTPPPSTPVEPPRVAEPVAPKVKAEPKKHTTKVAEKKAEPVKKKAAKPKPAEPKATPKPAPKAPPAPKPKCGQATVTLPENVYHRIKGLLNEWPNAASREVGKSGKKMGKPEYVVIIAPSNHQNEQMMMLISKGFKPRQEQGLVVLGKFTNRADADRLRQRVFAHGVRANVMEKHRPGEANLSQANYRVLFMNINDADARKLSGILKPYAPLNRSSCK